MQIQVVILVRPRLHRLLKNTMLVISHLLGTYNAVFDGEKEDIGPLNACFWSVIHEFQLVSVARPQILY